MTGVQSVMTTGRSLRLMSSASPLVPLRRFEPSMRVVATAGRVQVDQPPAGVDREGSGWSLRRVVSGVWGRVNKLSCPHRTDLKCH